MRQFRAAQAQAAATQEALPIVVPKRIFEQELRSEFMAMALEYTDPDRENISELLLACLVRIRTALLMRHRAWASSTACGLWQWQSSGWPKLSPPSYE
jgi:hypothetical protein